jgi:hypothetical protein
MHIGRLLLTLVTIVRVAGAQPSVGVGESHYFRTMDVDPSTLAVTLRDGVPGIKQPAGEFFAPILGGAVHSISHYDSNQRYSYYTIGQDNVLTSRVKFQELATGIFGTVYAETKYIYGAHAILFTVRARANATPHEVPEVATVMPDQNLSLDAISVIRVFVAGSGLIVASAQYLPDGQLENVVIDGTRGGDWIHNNAIDELDPSLEASTSRGLADYLRFRRIFGFPERLPALAMLSDANLWTSGDRTPSLTLINLHYDRNRWVKQITIKASGAQESRILTYRITKQDRALESIERQLLFRPEISNRKK